MLALGGVGVRCGQPHPLIVMEVETSKSTSTAKEVRGITDRGTAPRFFLTRTRSATQKFTRGIATSESRRSDFMKVETTVFTSQN